MQRIEQRSSLRLGYCLIAAALLFPGPLSFSSPSQKALAAKEDALARLMDGNARFVKGQHRPADYKRERAELTKGQHPYAIVLSCSDSRVPPEIVFDEWLGKLFVVRVAGNVVDPITLGSIEYAAEHLHSKLLFLLGRRVLRSREGHRRWRPFFSEHRSYHRQDQTGCGHSPTQDPDAKDILPFAVEENVAVQTQSVLDQSHIIKELVEKKELRIAGGVYHLGSGKVTLMSGARAIN